MRFLDRIAAVHGARKSFTQSPFWADERLSLPMLASLPARPDREVIEHDLAGYIQGAYKDNGIVFGCILTRQLIFSEARFLWQQMAGGRPGDLFGAASLAPLERPWPGGTTGELLARMEVTASLAGSYYSTFCDAEGVLGKASDPGSRRIVHMDPARTQIVIKAPSGNPYGLDAYPAGYLYEPPAAVGVTAPKATMLLADEVCHYSPIPDPAARWRGMSWLTPILREITADKAATRHKGKFFENGGSPKLTVALKDVTDPDEFEAFVELMRSQHEGVDNAYRTLFLAGGADVTTTGADLKQLDFKATQGAGETRIALAAGVPAVVLGISEGLAGSSLNTGNFRAAARLMADRTLRPLWRMACASWEQLVTPPREDVRLWFDPDIAFLREDQRDAADIQQIKAQTIRTYVDAGYTPDSAVAAVDADDRSLLVHTGLYSVQLTAPGTAAPVPAPPEEG
ncbi:hypothetical protein GCM10010124_26060 [Pilimelia terevasa]|uniref:Phage portal protein n=1 Tax=Pilimelia terevasa TaxID=53372 RepID=A0A8J3BR23_9ACTN|nr:phage portal protein [Pilimelia terevasa]GGK32100.1 hypothetical protein GCM10010124_26060 [Pilimelia terevasa]